MSIAIASASCDRHQPSQQGSCPRFFQGCERTKPCAEHQTGSYQNVEKNPITEKQSY
jgi:hypothetical protein